MRSYDTKSLLDKFLGNLLAAGSEHIDKEVSLNISEAEIILFSILNDLYDNASHVGAPQSSLNNIAMKSFNILKSVDEDLTQVLHDAKKKLYKDDFHSVKYQNLSSPVHIYQVADIDTIISPFNIEYTKEWYEKEFGDEVNDIKEVILYYDVPTYEGSKSKPKYSYDDPKILFWDQATPEEIKYLGTNMSVQPNPSKLGTIKNFYGDIYTQRNFYDALEKYKDITEPEILCSKEW